MKCPKCGAENPPGSQFCGECGATLPVAGPAPTPPQTQYPNRPPNMNAGPSYPQRPTNAGPSYPQQPNPNITSNPYMPQATTTTGTGNRSGSKIIAIVLGVIGVVLVIVGIILGLGASTTGGGDASYNAGYGAGASLICCGPGIVLLIIAAIVFFMANRKR